MAGQADLKKLFGGGGSTPINGFVDMYETDPVVTKGADIYFKSGYVDTAVSNYPDATKRKWQRIPLFNTNGVGVHSWGTGDVVSNGSDMQYRFGRYILAYHDLQSSGNLRIKSTADMTVAPTEYTQSVGVNATWAPACMVWNGSETKLRVYCSNANNVYETTNGTSYVVTPLTGLGTTKYIIDVILVGTTYVALVSDGIYTSTNGTAWTLRQAWTLSPNPVLYYGKLSTDGTRVNAMYQGLGIYYTSTNLTTWTSTNTPSGYTSTGFGGYGNSKWLATFRAVDGTNYSATGTNGTSWTLSATSVNTTEVRWHPELAQYTGSNTAVLSKDGLNWISMASLGSGAPNGIGKWVINGTTTYGAGTYSTTSYGLYSDTIPEVVGLPYSLTTLALNANKYLRVK